jgi:hypothetical protein
MLVPGLAILTFVTLDVLGDLRARCCEPAAGAGVNKIEMPILG